MNTTVAASAAIITPPVAGEPAWIVTGRDTLAVRGGTLITTKDVARRFADETAIRMPSSLVPGSDYAILIEPGGELVAVLASDDIAPAGGFHYAPGGNAAARAGGDSTPAINAHSLWDVGYRPACADPRGMTCVEGSRGKFWVDVYLLGTEPFETGTSRFGVEIADGDSLPIDEDGETIDALDWKAAIALFAKFGKQLLAPDEFVAAAHGVTEGTSVERDPDKTGLDAPRTSKWGLMQATGNMSTWGVDGDPDGARLACRFGGSWDDGEFAGSRCADVGYWPDNSSEWIGARGRSNHLQLV